MLTLTPDEIHALTGYRRAAEQLAELHRLGYWRARRSRSGEVIVERAHYEAVAVLDDGEAWSFCRKVMSDGRDVAMWHPEEGYERHSARMDAQAAKRGDELMATVAAAIAAARQEERERFEPAGKPRLRCASAPTT